MLRLLDSNVFIEAKNRYYGFDLVPAFWTWLENQAKAKTLASTDLVYKELKGGTDELADWVKKHKELIFWMKSDSRQVANHVEAIESWAKRREGYRGALNEKFFDGADPFLVGVAAETDSIVVTLEIPVGNNSTKMKIPDACNHLGVLYENTFQMMRSLGARFV